MKKVFSLLCLFLMAFTAGDTDSLYRIPSKATSICAPDIDQDGDPDIISGHDYAVSSQWGGVSVMINNNFGYFNLTDSLLNVNGIRKIHWDFINANNQPDIFFLYTTPSAGNTFVGIVYDYATSYFGTVQSFQLYTGNPVDFISSGDLDNDGDNDLAFGLYLDKKWGVAYNDGSGSFSTPVLYDVTYLVEDITVGDLDGDNREDVLISGGFQGGGGTTEIYYSQAGGFQAYTLDDHNSMLHISDMDNDGTNDVVALNDVLFLTTIGIIENTGYQSFMIHPQDYLDVSSYASVISDLNNDSLPDLLVLPGSYDRIAIYYNLGNFLFDDVVELMIPLLGEDSRWMTCADFDGNGYNDLAITKNFPENITLPNLLILFNDGNGNFGPDPLGIHESGHHNPELSCTLFPNPFDVQTNIRISLQCSANIQADLFTMDGRPVLTLFNKNLESGVHHYSWDGMNRYGRPCPAGVYFLTISKNGKPEQTIRLMKMK